MPAPLDPHCIFECLNRHAVDYILIGGLAAALHGSPALTNDADILPSPTPENIRNLSAALRDLNARLRSPDDPEGIVFDPHPALLTSMATLNMTTRCGDLDLTFTPAGTAGYQDLLASVVTFDVDGLEIRVAALADIIRSKRAADRPKDRATLPILYALEEEIRLHPPKD